MWIPQCYCITYMRINPSQIWVCLKSFKFTMHLLFSFSYYKFPHLHCNLFLSPHIYLNHLVSVDFSLHFVLIVLFLCRLFPQAPFFLGILHSTFFGLSFYPYNYPHPMCPWNLLCLGFPDPFVCFFPIPITIPIAPALPLSFLLPIGSYISPQSQ